MGARCQLASPAKSHRQSAQTALPSSFNFAVVVCVFERVLRHTISIYLSFVSVWVCRCGCYKTIYSPSNCTPACHLYHMCYQCFILGAQLRADCVNLSLMACCDYFLCEKAENKSLYDEKAKQYLAPVLKALASHGAKFVPIKVEGDGNCLVHSISRSIGGTEHLYRYSATPMPNKVTVSVCNANCFNLLLIFLSSYLLFFFSSFLDCLKLLCTTGTQCPSSSTDNGTD